MVSAEDFTARTLNDHGNVTVMEVNGNYDADNSDGTQNEDPRQIMANDFTMLNKESNAFYHHIRNDTQGIVWHDHCG